MLSGLMNIFDVGSINLSVLFLKLLFCLQVGIIDKIAFFFFCGYLKNVYIFFSKFLTVHAKMLVVD